MRAVDAYSFESLWGLCCRYIGEGSGAWAPSAEGTDVTPFGNNFSHCCLKFVNLEK